MNGVDIKREAGETQLVFAPVLDIVGARSLYAQLSEVLRDGGTPVLDASRVERVDAAALQLLAAFCRNARDAGHNPRWHAASPALCEAATLLGLQETLGQPR